MTFEAFESYLREWNNFGDPQGQYDLVGITTLFAACLDNMRTVMPDYALEEIPAMLSDEQKEFLRMIAR